MASVPLNLQAAAVNIYIELSLAGGTGRSLAEHVGTRGGDSEGESLFFRKKIRGSAADRGLCAAVASRSSASLAAGFTKLT